MPSNAYIIGVFEWSGSLNNIGRIGIANKKSVIFESYVHCVAALAPSTQARIDTIAIKIFTKIIRKKDKGHL